MGVTELARGHVGDRPWGLTLGALGIRGLTGVLRLTSESKLFSIRFEAGAVIDATSSLLSDSAARVAMTGQLINPAQFGESVRLLALMPDRDEFEVVAEVSGLTTVQVEQLRRRVIAQRTARTMSIADGEFVVVSAQPLSPAFSLDIRPLIYLGALVHLPDPRLEAELAGLGPRFQLKESAEAELPAYGFTEAERKVVIALESGASIDELEKACPDLDRHTICAVVYVLVSGLACRAAEVPPPIAVSRTDTHRVPSKIDPNTSFHVPAIKPSAAVDPEPEAAKSPPVARVPARRTKASSMPGRPMAVIERSRAQPTGDAGIPTKSPRVEPARVEPVVAEEAPRPPTEPTLREPAARIGKAAPPIAPAPVVEPSPFDDIDLGRKSGVHSAIRPQAEAVEPFANSPFDDIDLARRSKPMKAVSPPRDVAPDEDLAISSEQPAVPPKRADSLEELSSEALEDDVTQDASEAVKREIASTWSTAPFDSDQLAALAHQVEAEAASPIVGAQPRPRTRTEQLLVFAAIPREPSRTSRNMAAQQAPLLLDDPLADAPFLDDSLVEAWTEEPSVPAPRQKWLRAGTESAWLPLELRRPAKSEDPGGSGSSGSGDT